VVEFFDYRCGHCKASLPAIKAIAARGNVRLALIEYPILTADSLLAAQAAVAARRQSGPKYLAFHFALMATNGDLPRERILGIARSVGLDVARLQRDMQDPAVIASVKASQDLAQRLRLDGTPSFVINNKVVVGELTEAELTALIKAAGG
jgi:protein-disulfide isomerase